MIILQWVSHYIQLYSSHYTPIILKQLALWQWAQSITQIEFSRKDAIEALGFPPRTIEASIKKLVELKRLEPLGAGRSTRYRVILNRA